MKEYNLKPTQRQRKAFDILVENGGNHLQAFRQAGFSEALATTPTKVTRSKGWKILLKQFVPNEKLATVLMEGLDANRESFTKEGELREFPDHGVRHKYLETGLKIKGLYPKEGIVAVQVNVNQDRDGYKSG